MFAFGALILRRAAAVRAIMPPSGTALVKRHQRFQTLLQRLRQVQHHPLLHQQPRRLPLLSPSLPAAADAVPRGAVQPVVGVGGPQGPSTLSRLDAADADDAVVVDVVKSSKLRPKQ